MATPDETRAQYRSRAAALRRELVDKMSALATAAFGLVAALAWNTAIQSLFKHYYPTPDDPSALGPLVGYAVAVSIIAVLVMLWIGRLTARLKDGPRAPAPR